jgi:hypothetical protein
MGKMSRERIMRINRYFIVLPLLTCYSDEKRKISPTRSPIGNQRGRAGLFKQESL